MDAGTATLLHFVPGDDSVARDMAVAVPTWGGDTESPGGHPGPSGGMGEQGQVRGAPGAGIWDVGCGIGHVSKLELLGVSCWCQALSSAQPGGQMRGTGRVGAAQLEPPGMWNPGKSSLWSKSLAHRGPDSCFGMHS